MTTVVEAARFLDGYRPGWFNEIDLDILNQDSMTNCVLGQLYGSYQFSESDGVMEAFGSREPFNGTTENQTDEWKQEIKHRRFKDSTGPDTEPRPSVVNNVTVTSTPSLTEETRLNILYCVDNADLAVEVKDSIYKELYSL